MGDEDSDRADADGTLSDDADDASENCMGDGSCADDDLCVDNCSWYGELSNWDLGVSSSPLHSSRVVTLR